MPEHSIEEHLIDPEEYAYDCGRYDGLQGDGPYTKLFPEDVRDAYLKGYKEGQRNKALTRIQAFYFARGEE